jgi:hypothetical protein
MVLADRDSCHKSPTTAGATVNSRPTESGFERLARLRAAPPARARAAALARLSALEYLYLADNKISDLSWLVESVPPGGKLVLDIERNPISCAEQADNLQALPELTAVLQTSCESVTDG